MINDKRKIELETFLKSVELNCDLENLNIALTHSSFCNENNLQFDLCNERLEFLGDAVLKLTISNFLYQKYPNYHEGELSSIRSIVVSDKTLEKIARKINLQKFIILGKAEESTGGRERSSTIACAFEALLGAIYLSGNLPQIKIFIEKLFEEEINFVDQEGLKINPKAMLQEYLQSITNDLPEYILTKQEGPPHNRKFYIDVYFKGDFLASGEGMSKKEAQKNAAQKACQNLGLTEKKENKNV